MCSKKEFHELKHNIHQTTDNMKKYIEEAIDYANECDCERDLMLRELKRLGSPLVAEETGEEEVSTCKTTKETQQ